MKKLDLILVILKAKVSGCAATVKCTYYGADALAKDIVTKDGLLASVLLRDPESYPRAMEMTGGTGTLSVALLNDYDKSAG